MATEERGIEALRGSDLKLFIAPKNAYINDGVSAVRLAKMTGKGLSITNESTDIVTDDGTDPVPGGQSGTGSATVLLTSGDDMYDTLVEAVNNNDELLFWYVNTKRLNEAENFHAEHYEGFATSRSFDTQSGSEISVSFDFNYRMPGKFGYVSFDLDDEGDTFDYPMRDLSPTGTATAE